MKEFKETQIRNLRNDIESYLATKNESNEVREKNRLMVIIMTIHI